MPVEIVGQQLRVRLARKRKGWEYRVIDPGRKGHLQLLLMGKPGKSGRWVKQKIKSIRFNLSTYRSWDDLRNSILEYVPDKYKEKALRLARKWWEEHKL
jgi:hypothetical protein